MKRFSKEELIALSIIFFGVVLITLVNLRVSIRRARDSQRQSDINSISDALTKYQEELGFFPPSSEDGQIVACRGENYDEVKKKLEDDNHFDLATYITGLRACRWGEDSFGDLEGNVILEKLPKDPKSNLGYAYRYISDTKRFQIYAYLEGGKSEDVYRQDIVDRGLFCGVKICNFGKAYSDTPLDKSLQEYENELLENKKLDSQT